MKLTENSRPQFHQPPIAWREAECAARRMNAEDACDDRVSENIFDIADEREEIGIITHRAGHDMQE